VKASLFYQSQLFPAALCCHYTLGFASPIPHGELIRFLLMRSIHFDVQGSAGHIGTSLSRLEFSVGVFYLFAAVLAWQLGGLPQRLWRSCASLCGSRSLLCRHHGCELEIPLYPPHRFFNRDYSVFDCGSMLSVKPI